MRKENVWAGFWRQTEKEYWFNDQSNGGRYSNVDAKTHLLAKMTSSEACSSSVSSSSSVRDAEPVTSLRVCHHCGYASLTETVQRTATAATVAPGSGTLPRRVVSSSITTAHYSASVTLPRRQLQQPAHRHSPPPPPPPLLPRRKLWPVFEKTCEATQKNVKNAQVGLLNL